LIRSRVLVRPSKLENTCCMPHYGLYSFAVEGATAASASESASMAESMGRAIGQSVLYDDDTLGQRFERILALSCLTGWETARPCASCTSAISTAFGALLFTNNPPRHAHCSGLRPRLLLLTVQDGSETPKGVLPSRRLLASFRN
jgi:hypothetical protein